MTQEYALGLEEEALGPAAEVTVYLCIEPVDMRNYAESIVMRCRF